MPENAQIIWDGVYPSAEQASASINEDYHENTAWVDAVFKSTKACSRSYQTLQLIPCCLPSLIFSAADVFQKKMRILDIGGAMGVHHFRLKNEGLEPLVEHHYIVETTAICEKAAELTYPPKNLTFHCGFPENLDPFPVDVAYLNGVLQYLIPYQKSLRALSAFQPSVICIERTYTGNFHSFFTVQKNTELPMLAQWINTSELTGAMKEVGYDLLEKQPVPWPFQWYVGNMPQEIQDTMDYSIFIFVSERLPRLQRDALQTNLAEYRKIGVCAAFDWMRRV